MDETLSELKAMRDFFIAAIESSQKNIELRQKSINALNVAIEEIEKSPQIENAPACGNRTRSNKE